MMAGRTWRIIAATLAAVLGTGYSETPPVVEFIGRAPKLRIYPGGKTNEGNDTWLMLTFGKIEELDTGGRRVQGRAIMSLAAEKGIIWSQENRSVGGALAVVTRMELPLVYGGSFRESCSGGGGGGKTAPSGGDDSTAPSGGDDSTAPSGGGGGDGGDKKGKPPRTRLLSEEPEDSDDDGRRLAADASVAVEIFVFQNDATVDYGDYQIEVLRGQMKFNVEGTSWPFCGVGHKLEVNMNIKVPGDKPPSPPRELPEEDETRPPPPPNSTNSTTSLNLDINVEGGNSTQGSKPSGGGRKPPRRKPKRKAMRQSAGKKDVDFDFPEAVLADNTSVACEVLVDTKGGKTNIVFTFPYFEDTLLYDPTAGFVDPDDSTESAAGGAESTADGAPSSGGATGGAQQTKTVVSGSFKMEVADAAAFCADEKVIASLKQAIGRIAKQDASAVDVTCAAAARRLDDSPQRRLAQSVDIKYDITIPEGSDTAAAADAAAAGIADLSADQITTIVNEELASAGAGVSVTVTEKTAPTKATVTQTTSTAAPSEQVPASTAPSVATASGGLALALAALAVASPAC